MNGRSLSLEQVEWDSSKIQSSFFHEWITFHEHEKRDEIKFSPEAMESLQLLINELQKEFVENTEDHEDEINTATLSLSTAVQVVERMETSGKWHKSISKFKQRVITVLSGLRKKKEIKKVTEKIEKKIKKYIKEPKIELYMVYQNSEWGKNTIWLPVNVWPDSTVESVIKSINAFLWFQKLINQRKNKTQNPPILEDFIYWKMKYNS